jgi:hypothetical protein
MVLLHCSS